MKKRVKKIIKILVALLISIVVIVSVIFYFSPSLFVDFYISGDERSIWAEGKIIPFWVETSGTNTHKLNDLKWSPDKKHLVYTDFVREVIYDKEYFIKVINARTLKTKTIFIGTYHTSHYRWLNNDTVRVYVSAGSGVRIYRDIDIHLKEPFVAIEHLNGDPYLWTPQAWYNYDD